jgi:hypothetical protein
MEVFIFIGTKKEKAEWIKLTKNNKNEIKNIKNMEELKEFANKYNFSITPNMEKIEIRKIRK